LVLLEVSKALRGFFGALGITFRGFLAGVFVDDFEGVCVCDCFRVFDLEDFVRRFSAYFDVDAFSFFDVYFSCDPDDDVLVFQARLELASLASDSEEEEKSSELSVVDS